MQLEQMFGSPRLERESCTTASKTVRRICGGEADLANKSFESSGEEGCSNRSKTGGGREAEERIVGNGRNRQCKSKL